MAGRTRTFRTPLSPRPRREFRCSPCSWTARRSPTHRGRRRRSRNSPGSFAYCRLILSVLAVFFRTRNPKLEPVNAAPVTGSESGVEQDAGSIVNCVSPPIDAILHSDSPIDILLPLIQFGLKYVFGEPPGCQVATPLPLTLTRPVRAETSPRFSGLNPAGVHASRSGTVVPTVAKVSDFDVASAAS